MDENSTLMSKNCKLSSLHGCRIEKKGVGVKYLKEFRNVEWKIYICVLLVLDKTEYISKGDDKDVVFLKITLREKLSLILQE